MGFRNSEETRDEKNGIVYYIRSNVRTRDQTFERLALQTHFVNRGESYIDLVSKYAVPLYEDKDILSISEKIISMCQNNIVEKKDVKLGFWAKFLSKFAKFDAHGGVGHPYKMQLAINIAGLPRILFACFCAAVMKLFGKKGVFYDIAGHDINGIDGFIDGSSFEVYSDIALLNPVNPNKVCDEIYEKCGVKSMIVDANDFGVNILGKTKELENYTTDYLASLIADNPAGQSDERTPFILIKPVKEEENMPPPKNPDINETININLKDSID